MKNSIMVSLFASLLLVACSKETEMQSEMENMNPTEELAGLLGQWQWVKSTGGIVGEELTPNSTNMTKMVLISDSTISFLTDGVVEQESEYELVEGKTIFSQDSVMLISIDGGIPYTFQQEETRLVLQEEIYDGYVHEYVRE